MQKESLKNKLLKDWEAWTILTFCGLLFTGSVWWTGVIANRDLREYSAKSCDRGNALRAYEIVNTSINSNQSIAYEKQQAAFRILKFADCETIRDDKQEPVLLNNVARDALITAVAIDMGHADWRVYKPKNYKPSGTYTPGCYYPAKP